jgi:hypothetical protein
MNTAFLTALLGDSTLPNVKGIMGSGQPILVQWPSLEYFTLSAEARFCLLVRLARPFQCQKVNRKENPKFQRLFGKSILVFINALLMRSRLSCMAVSGSPTIVKLSCRAGCNRPRRLPQWHLAQ